MWFRPCLLCHVHTMVVLSMFISGVDALSGLCVALASETDLAVTHVKLFVDGIDINRRCHASCGMWLFL